VNGAVPGFGPKVLYRHISAGLFFCEDVTHFISKSYSLSRAKRKLSFFITMTGKPPVQGKIWNRKIQKREITIQFLI
jgi:hypothetical protein